MITSIEVIKNENSLEKELLLAKKFDLTLMPRLNFIPIIGSNGCGKSTLLRCLSNHGKGVYGHQALDILITRPTDVYRYLNSKDNFKIKAPLDKIRGFDVVELADRYYSSRLSEGMGMVHSYMPLLDGLHNDAIPKNDDRDILIILDEFDSGLSLDNIDIVMNKIIDISIKRQDIQFIFSFNNPFILHYLSYCDNMLLSMYDGKPVHIVTDSGLLRFYRRKDNTRKFNKRRFDEDGEYIIY